MATKREGAGWFATYGFGIGIVADCFATYGLGVAVLVVALVAVLVHAQSEGSAEALRTVAGGAAPVATTTTDMDSTAWVCAVGFAFLLGAILRICRQLETGGRG